MGELAKIENICELNKTSLVFKREVTKEEWQQVFTTLQQVEGCVQFWIGDCLAYREQHWGMYDEISEESGIETRTLRKYKQISENVESGLRRPDLSFSHHEEVASLSPEKQTEFLDRAINEKLSVRELHNEIRKDKKQYNIKELPTGVYNLLYVDPPWQYTPAVENRQVENHYPTISDEDIYNLKLPTISNDCLLLIWATVGKLPEALKTINSWGFTYKSHSVWDKQIIGMGYWYRGQHELLLVATKGTFSPPEPEDRTSSIYSEKRGEHSRKPEYYYEWIEKCFPNTNKIELFSRNNRNGWEAWGNE